MYKFRPSSTAGSSTPTGKAAVTTNYFAGLTMRKNCEPGALSTISITKDAAQAYKNLKAQYEGKTVTDLGVLLAKYSQARNHTIEEHIEEFEKEWDLLKATLSTREFTKKALEAALRAISEDDDAKSEFLLMALPQFYNTLVENLRTNSSYTYGDIVRQLQLYLPRRQKGRKAKAQDDKRESDGA